MFRDKHYYSGEKISSPKIILGILPDKNTIYLIRTDGVQKRENHMQETFINSLMTHIMDGVMIPKVQVERAVGPILSMFLADVLTETLRDDAELSGEIQMCCPEFPLKKAENLQSTNVDWLMINPQRQQLLLVELKTSDTSVNIEQSDIYLAKRAAIRLQGGGFLVDDLQQMRDASKESGKYQYILEKKILPIKPMIADCHDAKIIYLVPKCAVNKMQGLADKVLCFEMLASVINANYAEEWQTIHRHLCGLDESSQAMRNTSFSGQARSIHEGKAGHMQNYQDKYSFDAIVALCRERGNEILVGVSGGVSELSMFDMETLQNRLYKWDTVGNLHGKKDERNWMRGTTFLKVVDQVKSSPNKKMNQPDSLPSSERPVYWQGTVKFDEMVALCKQEGNKIIIGYTGGKQAFMNASLEALQARHLYRWDYAQNRARKKLDDWLPGDVIIDLLKRFQGYVV